MTDSDAGVNSGQAIVERRRIRVRGTVQGVGFRPFVFRLAEDLHIAGSVGNDSEGVVIEVQGSASRLEQFERRLRTECPPLARLTDLTCENISALSQAGFVITTSRSAGTTAPVIPPDVAVCDDCLAEMRDQVDRRYRYPFINCTNCGPRYSITEGVPYDRPMTSMRGFAMCDACSAEYHDPRNRRFHAQPNACPICGPHIRLHDGRGFVESSDPLAVVQESLRCGKIVALRSLGGFHLACDASNERAVGELRDRKQRPHKPFAVMTPNLESARQLCDFSADETALLADPARPIVLLQRKPNAAIAANVAPDTDRLGLMLPSTPIHYLLFEHFSGPLIMTSGNLTDEPIAIANEEALQRLGAFADLFVLHDREIVQRLDDSIVIHAGGKERVVRRARGITPSPVRLPVTLSGPILACGGELKGAVALGLGNQAVMSQHLGDLDNPLSLANFEKTISHIDKLFDCSPPVIAHDLHPDYLSTRWGKSQEGARCIPVQHHHAHLVSVMADCGVTEPCIGIILDGTGYGLDGAVWGGEVLYGDARVFSRLAWIDPVPMPGGEAAIREPWRMALSYLIRAYEGTLPDLGTTWSDVISPDAIAAVCEQIRRRINTPMTSSCGRLFDGVASLLGLCHQVSYEAQAAIRLETVALSCANKNEVADLSCTIAPGPIDISWLIRDIWESVLRKEARELVARRFHVALAELLVRTAVVARLEVGVNRVALSGGVYQNQLFFEKMQAGLERAGFEVLAHSQVPTNDGGLALGQLMIADAVLRAESREDF